MITARMSSKVKGQGRHIGKCEFRIFNGVTCVDCVDPFCHDILGHVMSRRDVMTSLDIRA